MKTRAKRRASGSGNTLRSTLALARERWQEAKKSAKEAKQAAKLARRKFKEARKAVKRAKREALALARRIRRSASSVARSKKKTRSKAVSKTATPVRRRRAVAKRPVRSPQPSVEVVSTVTPEAVLPPQQAATGP